jgi:hypothetical protein
MKIITNDDMSYLGNHRSSLKEFLAVLTYLEFFCHLLFRKYALTGSKIVLTDRKVDQIQGLLKIRRLSINLLNGNNN